MSCEMRPREPARGPESGVTCPSDRGLHSSTFHVNLSRFGHTSPYPPV